MSHESLSSLSTRETPTEVTRLRSTLITTSLQSVRARGHLDRYTTLVDAAHRDTILHLVAGVWQPIAVGMAHYAACNALGLTSQEQIAIGREVGERVQGTFLGVVVRSAKAVGMTPWTGLDQATRLWTRLFVGGTVSVHKLGPKEAAVELGHNPLAGIPYFRAAFRGLLVGGALMFSQKAYASEVPKPGAAGAFAVKLAWV